MAQGQTVTRNPDDGIQELKTKNFGTVKVFTKSWIDGPGRGIHIVKCPNGAYCHATGQEIRSEKEIMTAIPQGADREDALNWFRNRETWEDAGVREITFERGTGYPTFLDTGQYVESYDDLYNYFPPGPVLTAAIQAMGERLKGVEVRPMMKAPEPEKPAAKAGASQKRREALAKGRATAQANREAKKAAQAKETSGLDAAVNG